MTKEEKRQPTNEEWKQAKEYFDKAVRAFENKEYYKAITLYGKVLEIDSRNIPALNNMGLAYNAIGKYKEAILCYDNVLEQNSKHANTWSNKGNTLVNLQKYTEASECLSKAIELDKNDFIVWGNKGYTLYHLNKYDEAITCFEEAVSINPNYINAWVNKGWVLLDKLALDESKNKDHYFEAGKCFYSAGFDIVDIFAKLNIYPTSVNQYSSYIAKAMLDGDKHFKNTVGKTSGVKLEAYKDIYIKSLQIVAMLHVDLQKHEGSVAHYTRRGIAELMIVAQSPFRLSTVTVANDPSEGKTLLDYLDIKEDDTSNYQAFAGSFIFNPDCLNQFRLYGKEDGREATGVSITVGDGFFSQVAGINKGLQMSDDIISKEEEKKEQAKDSLYRCIYIDPVTNRVVSVGHKEEYVFYREDAYIEEKVIDDYKKYIARVQKDVAAALASLKEDIDKLKKSLRTKKDRERAERILSGLLIHLRYLVKHVAFREEQECRIIRVEKIGKGNNNIRIDAGGSRMYCQTISMRDEKTCYITDIHFGPKASGKELFENILKHLELKSKISLHQSNHPFFS